MSHNFGKCKVFIDGVELAESTEYSVSYEPINVIGRFAPAPAEISVNVTMTLEEKKAQKTEWENIWEMGVNNE